MPPARAGHEPWRIHFFQRHSDEDDSAPVPATEFLASLPANTATEFHAILNAVAKAPPPARPFRLLLGGGQVGGEITQLGPGLRRVGGAGSFLELGLGQPAVGKVALQQGHGLLPFGVGGADG